MLFQTCLEPAPVKPRVNPVFIQKALMRSPFLDTAVFNDGDQVGIPDCGKTVRGHEGGPAFAKAGHSFLNQLLRAGIDAAGGFVENNIC